MLILFLEQNFFASNFPGAAFNLILWVLYTGMQWKCLPVPQDTAGKPAIHYTTVYRVFAKWADDGSLWQAFVASVARSEEHTSELQSQSNLVCRLLLEKKKKHI